MGKCCLDRLRYMKMDGFVGKAINGKIKDSIRSYIATVARLTSNALALVDRLN
jgi:hypothetical protein